MLRNSLPDKPLEWQFTTCHNYHITLYCDGDCLFDSSLTSAMPRNMSSVSRRQNGHHTGVASSRSLNFLPAPKLSPSYLMEQFRSYTWFICRANAILKLSAGVVVSILACKIKSELGLTSKKFVAVIRSMNASARSSMELSRAARVFESSSLSPLPLDPQRPPALSWS